MGSQFRHISKDAAGCKMSELPHQSKVLMNSMILTAGRPGSGVDILSEFNKSLYRLAESFALTLWKIM
jgi:hypothetical protein